MSKKLMTTVFLKEKSAVSSTLLMPRMTIDDKHSLKDYLPIFLQTHILKSQSLADINDPNISKICTDNDTINCEMCDKETMKICYKCARGLYKLKDKCFITCPKNYVADIFRRECHPVSNRSKDNYFLIDVLAQITYSKAFTTSSCNNQCGTTFDDCRY
jgi:hypothetical protein